jgi:hypothetical protein
MVVKKGQCNTSDLFAIFIMLWVPAQFHPFWPTSSSPRSSQAISVADNFTSVSHRLFPLSISLQVSASSFLSLPTPYKCRRARQDELDLAMVCILRFVDPVGSALLVFRVVCLSVAVLLSLLYKVRLSRSISMWSLNIDHAHCFLELVII